MADDTRSTEHDLPPGEGGTLHYGGTDAAYDGMEDTTEGDRADTANRIDRSDMDGLDADPPRRDVVTPPEMDPPPTASGDHSEI
ncbi:MAG: hypothetical protein AAGI52_11235 [Bacteroidota bacterium]